MEQKHASKTGSDPTDGRPDDGDPDLTFSSGRRRHTAPQEKGREEESDQPSGCYTEPHKIGSKVQNPRPTEKGKRGS